MFILWQENLLFTLCLRGVDFRNKIVTNYLTNHFKIYSTNQSKNYLLDPWFITGLFDAEGSFVTTLLKNPRYKTGWNVQARIKMHEKKQIEL